MTVESHNGNGRPVLMRDLDERVENEAKLIRAENKTEHVKTRALVVILAVPSVAKALPYVLGLIGWH